MASNELTQAWFVYEVAREMKAALVGHVTALGELRSVAGVGDESLSLHMNLNRWPRKARSIDVVRERFIRPAAKALASRIRDAGISVLYELGSPQYTPSGGWDLIRDKPLPKKMASPSWSIVKSAHLGVCLRGIDQYDPKLRRRVFTVGFLGRV